MSTALKIGHGGEAPEYEDARDLAGRGKRSGGVLQNIKASRIEWLFARSMIQKHHLDAGRRLQQDWAMGEIAGYARLSPIPGTGGSQRLADAKLDALARVRDACELLGGASSEGWRVVQFVVLDELYLAEVERRHKAPKGSALGALRVALNVLARHYGMV